MTEIIIIIVILVIIGFYMLRYLDGYYKIESYNLISKQPINRIRKGRVYKTGTLYTYEVTYFNGRKELEQKEIEL